MHTRLQLDPSAEISIRPGTGDTYELVILDPASECSAVIEMSRDQLNAIREGTTLA